MMGGQSSKKRGGDTPTPPLEINSNCQYTEDLSSYEDACKVDPDLQSFDGALCERTSHAISSLATGAEVSSLSLGSFKEVTNCLLEMNQDVVKFVLQSKEDVWNNQDLFVLVKEYFESSVKTLEFCNSLESCLKSARHSQLIIQVAIKQFEEEVEMQHGVVEKKYVKTLEELQKFKAAGDPFTKEFFSLFQSVYKQQRSMLKKLQLQKRKVDKKLKSMKAWRRVSNVLFVSAFVSVLIFSVVAAAIAAPPVVTALAGALAVPIGSVGKWCDSLWNAYMQTLKGQKGLAMSMEFGTFITINDMDSILVLIKRLEVEIESLMQVTDIGIREEDAVKLVIDEIKRKIEVFIEAIEDLGDHADKCSRQIIHARTVILQKMSR